MLSNKGQHKVFSLPHNYTVKAKGESFFALTGSSTEEDTEICKYLDDLPNTVNLAGKTDFEELINLVKNSEFVICNDSGILHLAEALDKKVYVTFGSTVREFGFFPLLKSFFLSSFSLSISSSLFLLFLILFVSLSFFWRCFT
jgi:ADP-heptose:LPS heptosyltransferase